MIFQTIKKKVRVFSSHNVFKIQYFEKSVVVARALQTVVPE